MNKVEPIKTAKYDRLSVVICESNEELGQAAALDAREIISKAIGETHVKTIRYYPGDGLADGRERGIERIRIAPTGESPDRR